MFFSNSAWTSSSSSGNAKTLEHASGSHSSSGSAALAVAQVAISGVNARVFCSSWVWPSVSPLVV